MTATSLAQTSRISFLAHRLYPKRTAYCQAVIYKDRFDNPTTLAKKGDRLYALNAKLNELIDPVEVPSKDFSLQLIRFVPMF